MSIFVDVKTQCSPFTDATRHAVVTTSGPDGDDGSTMDYFLWIVVPSFFFGGGGEVGEGVNSRFFFF